MRDRLTVWFATGNIHKKKELAKILSDAMSKTAAVDIKIPADEGLAFDPEETGNSFLENALIKAAELYRLLGKGQPVIADDSGICVDALDGRPGIYSARYGGKNVSDAERNARLLAEIGDNPQRGSRFVCAMVLYCGADRFFAAQETLEGELVPNAEAARGTGGFGYDPVLYIPELSRTVAELSDEEKNRLSHRGKAGRVIGRILSGLELK
jgi:XTP/dITP diphosphohydrolase